MYIYSCSKQTRQHTYRAHDIKPLRSSDRRLLDMKNTRKREAQLSLGCMGRP